MLFTSIDKICNSWMNMEIYKLQDFLIGTQPVWCVLWGGGLWAAILSERLRCEIVNRWNIRQHVGQSSSSRPLATKCEILFKKMHAACMNSFLIIHPYIVLRSVKSSTNLCLVRGVVVMWVERVLPIKGSLWFGVLLQFVKTTLQHIENAGFVWKHKF